MLRWNQNGEKKRTRYKKSDTLFEEWFYKTYNVACRQLSYANCRFDAIYNNAIVELKNYNWSKYRSYTSLIKKFTLQAEKYMQHVGKVFAGQEIQKVQFIFSTKPPKEILDKLRYLDIIISWISEG